MFFVDIHTHNRNVGQSYSIFSYSMKDMPLPENIFRYSIGIHPWFLSARNSEEQYQWLVTEANQPGVVAIGECGMDKVKGAPMDIQIQMFLRCVQLSEKLSLPMIIHAVKCMNELICLKKQIKPKCPWIIHGFRGRKEVAMEYLKHGFYLSFGEHYQEKALCSVPLDKFFLETDESVFSIEMIYQKVSETYGITIELLSEHMISNAKKVLFLR